VTATASRPPMLSPEAETSVVFSPQSIEDVEPTVVPPSPRRLTSQRTLPLLATKAEMVWRVLYIESNDTRPERSALATKLRCRCCGALLGAVLDLGWATVLAERRGDVYDRFEVLSVQPTAPQSLVRGTRGVSERIEHMSCPRGQRRPTKAVKAAARRCRLRHTTKKI
jgi:hypothetical protein